MVGLFGTVFGMMGAFSKVSASESTVDPKSMAATSSCTCHHRVWSGDRDSADAGHGQRQHQDQQDAGSVGIGIAKFYDAFKAGLTLTGGMDGIDESNSTAATPVEAEPVYQNA